VAVKSDHDPVKALIGILGEVSGGSEKPMLEEGTQGTDSALSARADAGGKTLEGWLEELEKGKLDRLSRDIERRVSRLSTLLIVAETNALDQYKELQTSITVTIFISFLLTQRTVTPSSKK
jgi:hypothetical protein